MPENNNFTPEGILIESDEGNDNLGYGQGQRRQDGPILITPAPADADYYEDAQNRDNNNLDFSENRQERISPQDQDRGLRNENRENIDPDPQLQIPEFMPLDDIQSSLFDNSWRWDFRRIKIFKTDNTGNPVDPFYSFYRTRNQTLYKDTLRPADEVDLQKRILVNNAPLSNGGSLSQDIKEGFSSNLGYVTRPIRSGNNIYFNWSYSGYLLTPDANLTFSKLYRGEGFEDLSQKWQNYYFSLESPSDQTPLAPGDSTLSYADTLPQPFVNTNGINLAQRLSRLAISSSMQRMSALDEEREMINLTTNSEEGRSLILRQMIASGLYAGDENSILSFATAYYPSKSPANSQGPALTAWDVQQKIDELSSAEQASRAAISVYTPDQQYIQRKNSYVSYEFYDFESKLPFVNDIFVQRASRTWGPNREGFLPDGMAYANMGVNYNFYLQEYEQSLANPRVVESQIPNYYSYNILSELAGRPLAYSPDWEGFEQRALPEPSQLMIERGNSIENDYKEFMDIYGQTDTPDLVSNQGVRSFLNTYGKSLSDNSEEGTIRLADAVVRGSRILLASRDLKYFSSLRNSQGRFPMATQVSLPLRQTGLVGKMLFGYHDRGFTKHPYRAYTSVALNAYLNMEDDLIINQVPYTYPAGIESYGYANSILNEGPVGNRVTSLGSADPSTPPIVKTPVEENNSLYDVYTAYDLGDNQLNRLNIKDSLKVYDFDQFLSKISDPIGNFTLLTKTGGELTRGERLENSEMLLRKINLAIEEQYNNTEEWLSWPSTNFCTFLDIVKGREVCTSETLFYKILKYKVGATAPENLLVQTIYIPNSPEFDDGEFIYKNSAFTYTDTQVKYGETYRYEVMACDIVYGSEIRYRSYDYNVGDIDTKTGLPLNPDQNIVKPSDTVHLSANIETITKVKIVEYPIILHDMQFNNLGGNILGGNAFPDAAILDYPPPPPEVLPIPLQGNYQQILFGAQPASGEFTGKFSLPYIPFTEREAEEMYTMAVRQKMLHYPPLRRGEMEFKTDDESEVRIVEVYRTEALDTNVTNPNFVYKSFTGQPIAVMNNSGDPDIPEDQVAKAFDFMDTILPNKKYYYTLRCEDRHGNKSNPSPIYEVELYYNKGFYIPHIRVIEPEITKNTVPTKKMIRYLELAPSPIQTAINDVYDSDGNFSGQKIGYVNEDINNIERNNFLVRVTSRDTGRKVGILVKFNKNIFEPVTEDE